MVVASLIDKAPNLGGLCRTCEILGVGSLVIPSMAVVKDKEFSAVSVTAENWIPLQECQSYKLPDLLQEKKKEGFTIVAVEQTAESVLLNNYTFPKKCVFLLGKEKEGVPVELLNQVDVCIEIPQSGLIRKEIHCHLKTNLLTFYNKNSKMDIFFSFFQLVSGFLVFRSFNVHVTGALVVWEYVKQMSQ